MKKAFTQLLKNAMLALFFSSFFTSIQGCSTPLLLAGGAAGLGYYFGSERRDADTITQDKKAEKQMIALMEKAGINTENILVRVFNHKMLLIGRTRKPEKIKKLSRLARQIPHVNIVYNRTQIGKPLTDKQKTKDALLAAKIKAALIAEKGLNSATIKYEVFNGEVYLMGLVTKEEAEKAITVIRKIKGVKKVIDAMERL